MKGVETLIKRPNLSDPDLAYETGVHLGDGTMGIWSDHYRFVVYGNDTDEREYFEQILIPLIEKLYGIKTVLQKFKNTCYISIYSKDLIKFKSIMLGLPIGPKDRLNSLPSIFVSKDKHLLSQLVAGIFDTDGSVKINRNKYPRLTIGLKNKCIISELREILLNKFNICPTMYKCTYFDRRVNKPEICWRLDINGLNNLKLFLKQIPIRSPKHLNKIHTLFGL